VKLIGNADLFLEKLNGKERKVFDSHLFHKDVKNNRNQYGDRIKQKKSREGIEKGAKKKQTHGFGNLGLSLGIIQ
jgi:hypothetical protein